MYVYRMASRTSSVLISSRDNRTVSLENADNLVTYTQRIKLAKSLSIFSSPFSSEKKTYQ